MKFDLNHILLFILIVIVGVLIADNIEKSVKHYLLGKKGLKPCEPCTAIAPPAQMTPDNSNYTSL
jgi:hypothetical protein